MVLREITKIRISEFYCSESYGSSYKTNCNERYEEASVVVDKIKSDKVIMVLMLLPLNMAI